MDIRSMLHDEGPAAAKPLPPQPVPPQLVQEKSYQQRSQSHGAHPLHDQSFRERPSSYGPPLQHPDPRSPQAASGYFSLQSQSPYQNSATSAGTHSFSSQSPGSRSQMNTPRDTYTPHQQQYGPFPPPSPSVFAQPQTPGGQGQQYHHFPQPTPLHANGLQQLAYNNSQSSREHSAPTNGTPTSQSRHISPEAQYHPHPATPLGPPASFPKPLPQNQRPSLGQEHYRTYSSGSTSSLTTREPSHNMPSPEQFRRGSIQRQMSMDRERERSISVSPKTIPRPSPLRQPSGESHLQSRLTPPMSYLPENGTSRPSPSTVLSTHSYQQTPPPSISYAPSREQQTPSQPSSTRPSPSPAMMNAPAPHAMNSSPPAKPIPLAHPQEQPSLKRTASVMSGVSVSSQPIRKRLKRDEIPIWARSARPDNPPRLSRGRGPVSYQVIKEEPRKDSLTTSNGTSQITATPTTMMVAAPPRDPTEGPWEPSIMNIIPYEDLTRSVCQWIVGTIGNAETPSGGAVFEIEAKIGEICAADDGERINLPVSTETIFNKDKFRATKFESTMNVAQHKKINEFLNGLVGQILSDPSRMPLLYTHPHEADEFFELTLDGIAHLPPSITQWSDKRRKKTPRVRITTDLKTNTKKAQIIKSRIADLEIHNPQCAFDFRISISIESPWDGQMDHLIPIGDGSNDRMKDRMSYRHGAYQIDLTQISYHGNQKPQQHELEVEISTELIRKELDNLKRKRKSRYEELVRGFIDNVRILCRTATLVR